MNDKPINTGILGSKAMTILGAGFAMLQVLEVSLPENASPWIGILIRALTAGALALGGYYHPGRAKGKP